MRRRLQTWVLAGGMLLWGSSAQADSILQIKAFAGAAFDPIGLAPFDPALGTLDSVAIAIDGRLVVNGTTRPRFESVGPFLVPTPYPYTIEVLQRFQGPQKFFQFNDPARFIYNAVASGTGEPFLVFQDFNYAFTFNASTDPVGVVVPGISGVGNAAILPLLGGISGRRGDFVDDGIPINEVDLIQSLSSVGSPLISSWNSAGTLHVTYNYTPAPQVPPVMEPTTVVMLGLGVGGVVLRRRHARRHLMA